MFGEGGFRYLLDKGVNYTDARYQHANAETIVEPTTFAHGMVANVWCKREQDRLAYNIENPD